MQQCGNFLRGLFFAIFVCMYLLFFCKFLVSLGSALKTIVFTNNCYIVFSFLFFDFFFPSEYSKATSPGRRSGTWDTTNTLKFRATKEDDGSTISCVVEHPALPQGSRDIRKEIELVVYCKWSSFLSFSSQSPCLHPNNGQCHRSSWKTMDCGGYRKCLYAGNTIA